MSIGILYIYKMFEYRLQKNFVSNALLLTINKRSCRPIKSCTNDHFSKTFHIFFFRSGSRTEELSGEKSMLQNGQQQNGSRTATIAKGTWKNHRPLILTAKMKNLQRNITHHLINSNQFLHVLTKTRLKTKRKKKRQT